MTPPLATCSQCAWLGVCGGRDEHQPSLEGCFSHCGNGLCEKYTWVCPCRGDAFRAHLRDVGGLHPRPWGRFEAPTIALPPYIPLIRHGRKREVPFGREVVGISIRDLLPRNQEKSYYPVATDGDELRRRFGIAPGVPLLVSSVAPDHVIEPFWAFRNVTHIPALLAELGIAAMTTPNFSFFTDAPRTHTLYNRKRIVITAEELSAAGIAVIPHLNAITLADWDFWKDLLLAQPHITYVCKEMQTGNKHRPVGLRSLHRLDDLQQRLGRPLHPVLIGGAQYVRELASLFQSYTVADSHPFMTAMHRRELVGTKQWVKTRFSPRSLDALLERNVVRWDEALRARALMRPRRSPTLRLAS